MTDLTERLQRYVRIRREKPLPQLGDSIHCVHTGTEHEAELRLSDLTAGVSLLETLTQENARLREAIEPFIRAAEPIIHDDKERWKPDEWIARLNRLNVGQFRALHAASQPAPARKALGGGDEQ